MPDLSLLSWTEINCCTRANMSDALSDDGHGFWRFCPRDVSALSLVCGWLVDDCIEYYKMGGVTGDNSVVYDFYFLAARRNVYAKIKSTAKGSYRTFKIFADMAIVIDYFQPVSSFRGNLRAKCLRKWKKKVKRKDRLSKTLTVPIGRPIRRDKEINDVLYLLCSYKKMEIA